MNERHIAAAIILATLVTHGVVGEGKLAVKRALDLTDELFHQIYLRETESIWEEDEDA